jgi:hypothetical protein
MVYILILGLGLLVLADTTIREFIDPTYHVVSARYFPRALVWYVVVYCWYKYLTTAYKIEIKEDDSIRLTSLIKKKELHVNDIKAIRERTLFVDIFTDGGSTTISTLIDGVSNVKTLLQATTQKTTTGKISQITTSHRTRRQRLMQITFFILLAAYAVYIEIQQIALHSK